MKVTLSKIELKNFKTYGGTVAIDLLKTFTAVVGPNGSGKSNLFDAICFALGEKMVNLRVKAFPELIHRSQDGNRPHKKASVTLVFETEDGTAIRFTRSITRSAQQFFWNDEVVPSKVFLRELERLGINVKAKNFLVYQGMVESIAMMDEMERTSLFEEASGSNEFKAEYEELKRQMIETGNRSQSAYSKKRLFMSELKAAKKERSEAANREEQREELENRVIELQLFKLFHHQLEMERVMENVTLNQSDLTIHEDLQKQAESHLKETQKSLKNQSLELVNLEKSIPDHEKHVEKAHAPLIKVNEKIGHIRKKLQSAETSLKHAKNAHHKHKENVLVLKQQLSDMKKEPLLDASLSQGIDLELEASQADDYNKKKREVGIRIVIHQQKLDALVREQKENQDRLDNKNRKYDEINSRIKQKTMENEEATKRLEKLSDNISAQKRSQQELETRKDSLSSDCLALKSEKDSIENELSFINAQLSEAHIETSQLKQENRKCKVVGDLKSLFPGVFDRLINLCETIHMRYDTALTKVMGKQLDAIVVDKMKTAHECIKYLRDQRLGLETFLPLDSLEVKPLKQYLQSSKIPPNCHLLYNVVNFSPPEVKKAVLFVTKSVLVCETDDDARHVAYELFPGRQLDAVSLGGTYFRKSGIISGGNVKTRKARCWDMKQVAQWKDQREVLQQSLYNVNKKLRVQSDLETIDCEMKGFSNRLKFMKTDYVNTESKISRLIKEISELETAREKCKDEIQSIELQIDQTNIKLRKIEETIFAIEDDIFKDFCAKFKIPNVRTYEESGLSTYIQRTNQKIELLDRMNRLQNQIDYEMTLDTKGNIRRWKDEVKKQQEYLQAALEDKERYERELQDVTNKLKQHQQLVEGKKEGVNVLERAAKEAQEKLKEARHAAKEAQRAVNSLQNRSAELNVVRRSLLLNCKAEDIPIPTSEGDLTSVTLRKQGSCSDSSSATTSTSEESNINDIIDDLTIDFDLLGDDLKEYEGNLKEREDMMQRHIEALRAQLPALPCRDVFDETRRKYNESTRQFHTIREEAREAKLNFDKIKRDRTACFYKCFDQVADDIDHIYKKITGCESASAILSADDPEEPYLKGIRYNCIAPGKGVKPMQSLSGGEKTVASLALLIALLKSRSVPFLLLDEIDAALDNVNIRKVADYFRKHTSTFQTIAVSLNLEFFHRADALIGVTRDENREKSRIFTFDLCRHQDEDDD